MEYCIDYICVINRGLPTETRACGRVVVSAPTIFDAIRDFNCHYCGMRITAVFEKGVFHA